MAEAKAVEALGVDDVLAPVEAMRGYPAVAVSPEVAADIRHGKVLDTASLAVDGEGPWAVVGGESELLAVYEPYDEARVKPAVVIASD